jgi:hypothetical protein
MAKNQQIRPESQERIRLLKEWFTTFGRGADKTAKILFLAGTALALSIWGCGLIGISVNIWLGLLVLLVAFVLATWAVWIWEGFSRFHIVLRMLTILAAASVYFFLVGKQAVVEYQVEHSSEFTIPPLPDSPAPPKPPETAYNQSRRPPISIHTRVPKSSTSSNLCPSLVHIGNQSRDALLLGNSITNSLCTALEDEGLRSSVIGNDISQTPSAADKADLIAVNTPLVSTDEHFTHASDIVLRTNRVIPYAKFDIECTCAIGRGLASALGTARALEVTTGKHLVFTWSSPTFEPGVPITIKMWSNDVITVTKATLARTL